MNIQERLDAIEHHAKRCRLISAPFAVFRFCGQVSSLDRASFERLAVRGAECKCAECLACRAYSYLREVE